VEALGARSAPPRLHSEGDGLLLDFGGGGTFPLDPSMTDLARQEQAMAQAGVNQAVLSIIPPAVDGLDAPDARAVASASNDALAELSGRFRALATLPAVDPEARFRPIFESAAELGVPIVLHPTTPAQPDAFIEYGLMTTVGFIVETTVCVLRLVLSGLFERTPDLRLLVPHVGAAIPYLFGRIAYEAERYGVGAATLSAPVGDQLRRLYVDSVSAWAPAIGLALELFGSDRVLFGTDAPFWERERNVEALERTGLAADGLEKVFGGNAERLFGD
jgi:hypothetical protein